VSGEHPSAQLKNSLTNAGFDGPERDAQPCRDFRVAQFFEIGQFNRLALLLAESCQLRLDFFHTKLVLQHLLLIVNDGRKRQFVGLRFAPTLPFTRQSQVVISLVASDRYKPREYRASG
jgi:hypothetical protein